MLIGGSFVAGPAPLQQAFRGTEAPALFHAVSQARGRLWTVHKPKKKGSAEALPFALGNEIT